MVTDIFEDFELPSKNFLFAWLTVSIHKFMIELHVL